MADVGIFAANTSTPVFDITVCLGWVDPTGCPHAPGAAQDANHVHYFFDTHRSRGNVQTGVIAEQALDMGIAEYLRRNASSDTTPQSAFVGLFKAVPA